MANMRQNKQEVMEGIYRLYGTNPPPEATRLMDRLGISPNEYWEANKSSIEKGIDKGMPEIDIKKQMIMERMMKKLYADNMPAPGAFQYINPSAFKEIYDSEYKIRERETKEQINSRMLTEAKETIEELTKILENIKKEALILYKIDRLSKDKKHAYVKKGELDVRVESVPNLEQGDEVLLHPKTFQIVEHLGKPPLEVSPFAPGSVPNVHWDDIGGLEDAKSDLIEAIEMPHTHKELYAHYDKKQIKGILLSGPPGCGKTMLGKAAATSLARIYGMENSRTGFLYVKGPEILNQYVGQTEQTIRDMFYDARRHLLQHGYPAIIFLDEADAILAARGSRNIGIGNTVVPMFLTEMDGLEESGAIVIIATNRPDVLDPAIVRDGRIDRKITVTRPNKVNALAILEMNLKKTKIHGHEIPELANEIATIMYADDRKISDDKLLRDIVNGAMLANVVHMAVSFAIQRDIREKTKTGITVDDVKLAVQRIEKQSNHVQHDVDDGRNPMVVVAVPVPVESNAEAPVQPKPTRTIN